MNLWLTFNLRLSEKLDDYIYIRDKEILTTVMLGFFPIVHMICYGL